MATNRATLQISLYRSGIIFNLASNPSVQISLCWSRIIFNLSLIFCLSSLTVNWNLSLSNFSIRFLLTGSNPGFTSVDLFVCKPIRLELVNSSFVKTMLSTMLMASVTDDDSWIDSFIFPSVWPLKSCSVSLSRCRSPWVLKKQNKTNGKDKILHCTLVNHGCNGI